MKETLMNTAKSFCQAMLAFDNNIDEQSRIKDHYLSNFLIRKYTDPSCEMYFFKDHSLVCVRKVKEGAQMSWFSKEQVQPMIAKYLKEVFKSAPNTKTLN